MFSPAPYVDPTALRQVFGLAYITRNLSALNTQQPYSGPASPAVVAACRHNTSDPSIVQNTPVNTLDEPNAKIMPKSVTLFLSLRNKVIIQEVGCPNY